MTNASNAGMGTPMASDEKNRTSSTISTRNYQKEKLEDNSLLGPWLLAVEKDFSHNRAPAVLQIPVENFDRFFARTVVALVIIHGLQEQSLLELVAQVSNRPAEQIKSYVAFDFGDTWTRADFGGSIALSPELSKTVGIGVWQAVLDVSERVAEATSLPEELVKNCAKLQIDRLFLATPIEKPRSRSVGII
jgi:hypothetical protein